MKSTLASETKKICFTWNAMSTNNKYFYLNISLQSLPLTNTDQATREAQMVKYGTIWM